MTHLQNKSDILMEAAKLSHDKGFYPAVAHNSYYCCFQLLKHIWLHSIKRTEYDLRIKCKSESKGSHEVLINEIGKYIKGFSFSDYRIFNANIGQLKELRVNADYKDELFDKTKSYNSIALSNKIILILKRY